MTMLVSLTVNERRVDCEIAPQTLLVDLLRGPLGLTGTHVGCDTSQCGACTVLVDGKAVRACSVLAAQVAGRSVRTVEGLAAQDGALHPVQEAFIACHGLQCGFCTPGMMMSAVGCWRGSRSRARPISSPRSRATSAAAPVTSTSSPPCAKRRRR